MKTFTIKQKAYITPYCPVTPQELAEGKGLHLLSFSSSDMTSQGWTVAGEATITIEIADPKTLIDNKVTALKAEAKAIRAKATAEVTRIEGQIQELLAITYEAPQP